MEDLQERDRLNTKELQPQFLKVLCILSYIWIGLSFLYFFLAISGGPATEDQITASKVEISKNIRTLEELGAQDWIPTIKKAEIMNLKINDQFYLDKGIFIIGVLLGLYGVIMMSKGKKNGFHFYIIYSLLWSFDIYFFVSPEFIPTFYVIIKTVISALFVFMYSRNLHWLK